MKKGMGSKEGKRVAQFIVNLSQEFAKPLTLMMSPLEMMLAEESNPEKKETLQLIQRNAQKFRGLTEKLFDVSKIISSKPVIELQKSDLIKYLKSLVDSFEEASKARNIEIRFESNVDELYCLFDSQKTKRIFYALLANGIRFNKEGGTIFFRLNYIPGDSFITIKFSDTGIGIVPEKLPYVFDPFYEDEDHLRLYQSTGLGLYLVKLLCDLLEAEINVESVKNQGTTFTILFPVLKNLSDVHYTNYIFEKDLAPEKMQFGAQVLDVDTDEIIDVNSLGDKSDPFVLLVRSGDNPHPPCRKLFINGYRILEATSAREALASATENSPDLVVICESFSESTVTDVLKLLRKNDRTEGIPTVVLQKDLKPNQELKIYKEGADLIADVNKTKEILKIQIDNLLRGRKKIKDKAETEARDKFLEIKTVSLDEQFINRLNAVIEKNIDNYKFDMQKLSSELFMSRTQVHRKLKAITQKSTTQYIRDYKLTRARQDLSDKIGTVSEIAYRYGFSSPAYFTRIFKEHFGITPSEVKQEDSQ